MSDNPPKLFVSYSWSNPDHEVWVIDLANQLSSAGVHVVIDKWDLKEGQDAHAFMERMVSDQDIKRLFLYSIKHMWKRQISGVVG